MRTKLTFNGKTAFYLFIPTVAIVVLTVWITGLDIKRTITVNAFYSLSILTFLFFAFVTIGLYRGVGITDDFGNIKSKIGFVEPSGISGDIPFPEIASDGIEGIVAGILLWIGIMILIIVLAFFFETIVYAGVVIFSGILYWIFYRATKLIFRYSPVTKNNLAKSMWIGLRYSFMYTAWIYAIILLIELIKK
jgi:hypothetical protein